MTHILNQAFQSNAGLYPVRKTVSPAPGKDNNRVCQAAYHFGDAFIDLLFGCQSLPPLDKKTLLNALALSVPFGLKSFLGDSFPNTLDAAPEPAVELLVEPGAADTALNVVG